MQKYVAQAVVLSASLLLAAILLVVGVGFFGAAVYFALREEFSQPIAALLTGVCGVLLAAIVVLAGLLISRATRSASRRKEVLRAEQPAPANVRGIAADLGIVAGEEFAKLARTHAYGTLAASLVAGIAVGASPGLRRLLRDLLEI
jgi:hypothetical protein